MFWNFVEVNPLNETMNLGFALDYWAEQQPQKIAVHTDSGSISYAQLQEKSSRLAGLLQSMGLTAQDTVLLFMPSCMEYIAAFYAAAKQNLHIAPANAFCKSSELLQMIQMTRPKLALVADDAQTDLLRSVDETLPALRIDLQDPAFLALLDTQTPLYDFPGDLQQANVFVSTSGSTGKLKFVSNTYQNEILNAGLYLNRLRVTKDDVLLTGLPVTHKFGMAAMLGSCIAGCTMVMPSQFRAENMIRLIAQFHVSVQYGVPTMYIREMEACTAAECPPDISSLRTGVIAGAPVSSDVFRWFEEYAGCRLLNCYGTSEIGGLTMTGFDDPPQVRYATCGQVFSNASLEIVDGDGNPLPPGMTGEITGTVPWVMNGYVGEPELTASMFDAQHRFLTGDVGRLDEAGNLVICGRKKNMIIRGGYNIFPAEVELALLRYADLSEACVMGYRDSGLGERICAFVKIKDGASKDPEQIRDALKDHIAKYKLPDRILFMEELPKLPNGKFNYPALSALLQENPPM